ncbi:MAG: hypothetical protein PHW03_00830 [Eubacteriales bacterium]|nr:hypothetical protein [Eubacteriales bacterium]MDD4389326.1 hypothetical protein [Eubacteriales bacterium]
MNYIYLIYIVAVICFFLGIKFLTDAFVSLRRLPPHGGIKNLAAEKRRNAIHKIEAIGAIRNLRREKVDKEVYEAMAFIRNFTAATGGSVGSEFILEQLADRESPLKQTYIKALGLMRLNKLKEAELLIAENADTEAGRSLASLLLNWDEMKPEQLIEILETRSRSIREIYITGRKRREEILSDIIYFPVVVNVFMIFINFIYIGYFMQQKELLKMLF